MNKEFKLKDLRTGDIVVFKNNVNGIVFANTIRKIDRLDSPFYIICLEDYNSDLTTINTCERDFNIDKVYRIVNSECITINYIVENLPENCVELIWKREREIDWSKVPKFTKVEVRDTDEEEWRRAYFIEFKEEEICLYRATFSSEFTYREGYHSGYNYIRPYNQNDIKEEWYK